MEVNMVGCWNW